MLSGPTGSRRRRRVDRTALSSVRGWRAVCQRFVGSAPGGCATADPRRRSGGLAVFGYHCRYLRIDLTTAAATRVPLSADVLRRFLGGVGLGTWILHSEAATRVDPLS